MGFGAAWPFKNNYSVVVSQTYNCFETSIKYSIEIDNFNQIPQIVNNRWMGNRCEESVTLFVNLRLAFTNERLTTINLNI